MLLVDFLLNVAALVMWVSWRGIRGADAAGTAGTILGNLRAAGIERPRRWPYLAWLAALLFLRAILYRQMGPSISWHPAWSLGAATLAGFATGAFGRMVAPRTPPVYLAVAPIAAFAVVFLFLGITGAGDDLATKFVDGSYPRFLRMMPVDIVAGALCGTALGLGFMRSFAAPATDSR